MCVRSLAKTSIKLCICVSACVCVYVCVRWRYIQRLAAGKLRSCEVKTGSQTNPPHTHTQKSIIISSSCLGSLAQHILEYMVRTSLMCVCAEHTMYVCATSEGANSTKKKIHYVLKNHLRVVTNNYNTKTKLQYYHSHFSNALQQHLAIIQCHNMHFVTSILS